MTISEIKEAITEPFLDFGYWISWKYRLLKHYIRWIKRLPKIRNWNGNDIYLLMHFQLKDVEYAMKNGYIDWTESPECLKSIRIAIKLSKRLGEGYSEDAAVTRFITKWPHTDDDFMVELRRERSEEEKKDLIGWRNSEHRQSTRDLRNLLDIIGKYGDGWMD